MDDLGLVEAVDRFGQGLVVAVADTPTEGSRPASARRSVYLIESALHAAIAVMDEPAAGYGLRT